MTESRTPPPPVVLLQVDLDSAWAVKQVYGLPAGPEDFDSDPLYALGLSRFLDLFRERGLRATFFAIGRDADVPAKADLLRRAIDEGHEVANHSQSHLIGLGSRPFEQVLSEVRRGGESIRAATGVSPAGFRAPGYDASPAVLRAVRESGLDYDASVLPTRAGFLLRRAAAFLRRGPGSAAGPGHYGSPAAGAAPRLPYFPDPEDPLRPAGSAPGRPPGKAVVELPLAVTRGWRLPLQASVGMALGAGWLRRGLEGLRREALPVIGYAFHAIDLVGAGEVAGLPGGWVARRVLAAPLATKRACVEMVLDLLSAGRETRLCREAAEDFRQRNP